MKLLMLNYEYPPVGGGGGHVSQRIVQGLSKKDSIVILTSGFKKLPFYEKKNNISIYRLPVFRKRKDRARISEMLLYVLLSFFFLIYIRIKYSFTAINIHFALPTGALSWWLKLLFNKPITLVMHGGDLPNKERIRYLSHYKRYRWLIKLIVNFVDKLIVVNPEVDKQLKALTKRKAFMIPNGVDTIKFIPMKTKKEFDILFMGRFIKMKNPMLAVESFKILQKSNPKSKMLMIGDGPLYDEIKNASKNLNIKLTKWVPHEDLPKHINKCKVYWSLQHGTNYGSLTILESMACGLPVILTKVGKSFEFALGKEFMVKHNPKEISKQTLKLLNPKKLKKYSKKSRELAEKYSIKEMAKKYRKIFTS